MWSVAAAVLMAPFVAWGAYTLHRRYARLDEFPMAVEAGTLAALAVFFAAEIAILRITLAGNTVYLIFAILGLMAAGAALYGPMLVSLSARLMVEVVAPGGEGIVDRPRFGPAEALERQRDYADALQEYLVLARVFPRDAEVHARVAANLERVGRTAEAPRYWQRAIKYAGGPADAVRFATRLGDTLERGLNDRPAARAALEAFLDARPGLPEAEPLRTRLAALAGETAAAPAVSHRLAALSEAPLETEPCAEPTARPRAGERIALERMDDAPPGGAA